MSAVQAPALETHETVVKRANYSSPACIPVFGVMVSRAFYTDVHSRAKTMFSVESPASETGVKLW